MPDEWIKKFPHGSTVVYTSNIEAGTGGVISARVGDIVLTQHVYALTTRQQAEALFAPMLGG
jgi:hypothetical protein